MAIYTAAAVQFSKNVFNSLKIPKVGYHNRGSRRILENHRVERSSPNGRFLLRGSASSAFGKGFLVKESWAKRLWRKQERASSAQALAEELLLQTYKAFPLTKAICAFVKGKRIRRLSLAFGDTTSSVDAFGDRRLRRYAFGGMLLCLNDFGTSALILGQRLRRKGAPAARAPLAGQERTSKTISRIDFGQRLRRLAFGAMPSAMRLRRKTDAFGCTPSAIRRE
ncbi:hypothetical protein AXG93_2752s1050 [Marchantia polymorpha subsp. ruderalis]|uniref:Uncharacterized protein n=1 Tax=Marchantia polymorpha subsp. ruderalis TaxID=1480154 RepID=A0A176VUP8_MARPO|nr:hypothetical protein AXG93_2752s1050 [Marchantia polymorpha subsp. ruderalis]